MIDEPEVQDGTFEEGLEVGKQITLLEAMQSTNLVPELAEQDVNRIGQEAITEYAIDLASLKDFHQRFDQSMAWAMQETVEKTFPWPRASNVIYPLLTEAAIQFQARSYPAIIDGNAVVKPRVLGPDPDGAKRQRGDRVAAFMNWQFLYDIPGWEDDTDRLLLQLPIVGCVMRKTWLDPIRNQVNSETISAKDFIVHYNTTSLDKAPRYTHRLRYYPHEIESFIRSGTWSNITYDGEDGSDPHSLVEMLEQCRLIDMDGDGLPEHYVVTCTTDGQVARIVPCFDADSTFVFAAPMAQPMALSQLIQAAQKGADLDWQSLKVMRIERKDYFTKYGFIPNPDGSFYDMGFGTLTGNLGKAVNTLINQLIDAGTLANMQGGFLGGGTKIKGGNMRFTPGEWKRVEGITSGPLRDNILPLQLPGPSATLFELLGMLIEAIKGITSVSDILSGNQDSQTAPTTALALIEQGQKVFTAIYQRIHRSLGAEARVVFTLNRDYLDEEKYFALDDDAQVVGRADFQDKDLDIMPVSDPRAINDQVKMAKAQILAGHNGDLLVNQIEIRKREFEAAGIDNIPALLNVPDPEPDPKLAADAMKAEAEVRAKDALTAKTLIEAATAAYALGTQLQDPNITAQADTMLHGAIALADKVSEAMKGTENGEGQPLGESGPVPGMGGPPSDGGVSPIPAGPGGSDGEALGVGAGPVGPDAGGSDPSGNMG